MALWLISLLGRRLFLKRRHFTFVLSLIMMASLSFIIYLMRFEFTDSKTIYFPAKPLSVDVLNDNREAIGEVTSIARNFTDDNHRGILNYDVWSDLCETAVYVLRNWPHFPNLPDKRSTITEFHNTRVRDTAHTANSGERIVGYLHPRISGEYKFAISSSGPSELWLSSNEDPAYSEMIARVYSPDESASTPKGDCNKYPDQISKEISLYTGKKYYIESLAVYNASKTGSEETRVAVHWLNCGSKNATFEIISSNCLSPFYEDINSEAIPYPHADRKDYLKKSKTNLFHFNRLPIIENITGLIPTCPYSPSFLVRRKLKRYEGVLLAKESFVFPQDDTDMSSKGKAEGWSAPNPLIDNSRAESIVNKLMSTLQTRKFYLKKIHKVIQKPDPENGERFLLDLEIGLNNTNRTFRLAEHVYQKSGSEKLCHPEGMNWNNSATVYFIIPVKNQGKWVHHFITQVTEASLLTGDTNFHVIIADFESKDIDMVKVFNTSLLSRRHSIVQVTGKFYKTLALNKAAEAVPNAHDIIFLFDLHIDVPADIMDSVRKNTIADRMAYFPAVGRLDCGSNSVEHRGFWQMNGFGLMAMYKSDWNRLGGMNTKNYKHNWGGEDWDLIDRVLMMTLELERIKYPGLYHHFHSKQRQWS